MIPKSIRSDFSEILHGAGFAVRGARAERVSGTIKHMFWLQGSTSSTTERRRFFCNVGVQSEGFAQTLRLSGVTWAMEAHLAWRIGCPSAEYWEVDETSIRLPLALSTEIASEAEMLGGIRAELDFLELLRGRTRGALSDAQRASLEAGLRFHGAKAEDRLAAIEQLRTFCAAHSPALPRIILEALERQLGEPR